MCLWCKHTDLDQQQVSEDNESVFLSFFLFQNAKLTVIPASTKISAQSVKVDFTYTLESALTIAQKGWKPTTIPWSASVLVRRNSKIYRGGETPQMIMSVSMEVLLKVLFHSYLKDYLQEAFFNPSLQGYHLNRIHSALPSMYHSII